MKDNQKTRKKKTLKDKKRERIMNKKAVEKAERDANSIKGKRCPECGLKYGSNDIEAHNAGSSHINRKNRKR